MDPERIAAEINARIRALRVVNTAGARAIRREYSRRLKEASASFMFALARRLIVRHRHRWFAYELIREHRPAFERVGDRIIEGLGRGIDAWWSVDSFARTLAGPAWLHKQISTRLIHRWARAKDRWWRRAALVCTVALNVRSHGGYGDVPRTLAVCRLLVADHDDMVVKAMSWALRELAVHDPGAAKAFLKEHAGVLAARVRREVMNKCTTGLKIPRRKAKR